MTMSFTDFYRLTYYVVLQKLQEFPYTLTVHLIHSRCSCGTIDKCRSQQEGRRECKSMATITVAVGRSSNLKKGSIEMITFSKVSSWCGLWIANILYIYKVKNGIIAVILCQVFELILLE